MLIKDPKGFTLIEILIVTAIIGLLMGILLPVLAAARRSGRRMNCSSNLKQIGHALDMFADNYDEFFPNEFWVWNYAGNHNSGRTLGMLYPKYVGELEIFQCPSAHDPLPETEVVVDSDNTMGFRIFTTVTSYSFHRVHLRKSLVGVISATDEDAIGTDYLNVPSTPNHNYKGANCLWVDGHVTWEKCQDKTKGVVLTQGLYSTDIAVGTGRDSLDALDKDTLGTSDAGLSYPYQKSTGNTQPAQDIFVIMAQPATP